MTGTSVLYMLLGALLVTAGVLVSALADRVRGLRSSREVTASRERGSRAQNQPARQAIQVEEVADLPRAAAVKPRAPRVESKPQADTEGGDDVIAALVAAGYKKPIATEATWACGPGERASIEGWTAAALRRCARGGMS